MSQRMATGVTSGVRSHLGQQASIQSSAEHKRNELQNIRDMP
jgi:uncharacterized NAD-dependent epimerase/dehydratase family protein